MNGLNDSVDFEARARPHLDALYRTALRMVRHAATAEDIVQETYLRAFAAFDAHSEINFRAWLFRILANLCVDHIRSAGRRMTLSIHGLTHIDKIVEGAPDPEQEAIARNVGADIRTAIEALPAELRLVVLLVLVEEMSYAEAAESLDVPVGTVRSRLNRARTQLQTLLSEHAPQGARDERRLKVNRVAFT